MGETEVGVSSLMDTWLLVRMIESNGERNRLLYVLKSRGMAHSNQMREFLLSDQGINLVDVYVGPGTVLTGSARILQEAADRAETNEKHHASERREREMLREAAKLKIQAQGIAARLANIEAELGKNRQMEERRQETSKQQMRDISKIRRAD